MPNTKPTAVTDMPNDYISNYARFEDWLPRGETVFFGELGESSDNLIQYLEGISSSVPRSEALILNSLFL